MSSTAIMTANPLTLKESDSVADAARALIEHRYINMPVVDAAGRFLGMFGIYDLLGLLIPRVALAGDLLPNLRFIGHDGAALREKYATVKAKTVGECCDRQAVTLAPDTPEIEAVRLFCRKHTTLAVVEPGTKKLLGIVSYWDAIAAVSGETGPA